MKSQYFNLLTLNKDFLSLCQNIFATSQRFFRGIVYAATGLSLTLMLASCGERPSGRVQISSDLMMTLTKQLPPHQSAVPAAASTASDFDKAILQAVEANDGYRAVLSSERAIMAGVGVAESVRRWQVNGSSTVGGIRERGGTKPSKTTTGIAGGIQASQLIYDGGESVANINSAMAEAIGAQVERIIIGNELALEAARAWIDVWQYEKKIDLLNARSIEMETVASQIERMASNGMMDRSAVDSVQRKIVAISLEQARLQSDLSQAHVRFTRFFNQKPSQVAMPTGLVTMSDARAQADAWQEAPVLQRSVVELILARNAVLAAKAAFKPKAKFQAGVTSPMQDGESTDISLGIALEYSFSDGGKRKSQLKAAEARMESAKISLTDAQRSLKGEMDAAVQQLTAIELSMPLVEQQITLSASGAKTAKSQLATGQANLNQVIEAKIENYRAEDRQITMHAENLGLKLIIASRTGLLGRLIGLSTDIAE
jgi:outer membrane protein, adhesin transport system